MNIVNHEKHSHMLRSKFICSMIQCAVVWQQAISSVFIFNFFTLIVAFYVIKVIQSSS